MKANMTPNPLDVVTIHASQGDTEARQWEFELHNNGELIDTSDITEQMFFKAYKGGTEQILPENTSTPTTSPFKGDIKYPQGLLTDQEFLYRQSPTEEDGLAKITDIKGNTLVWNQLVQNGNFASTSGWGQGGGRSTLTVANNIGTATLVNSLTTTYQNYGDVQLVQGHKILVHYEFKLPRATSTVIGCENNNTDYKFGIMQNVSANTWHTVNAFHTVVLGGAEKITICYFTTSIDGYQLGDQYQVRNLMVFDLTAMGLDSITDPSDFTSLFPLSYYSYNQGTLLSFMGNGIKTVGKNLFDLSQFANGTIRFVDGVLNGTGAQFHAAYGTYATAKKLNCPRGSQITISFDAWTDQNATSTGNGLLVQTYHYDGTVESVTISNTIGVPTRFTIQRQNIEKIGFSYGTQGANRWHIKNFQVEFGTTETSYEPYTESTLSLPISTYFPTGMKSAGSVYDELTEGKAITRIGVIDLGSLTWRRETGTAQGQPYVRFRDMVPGIKSSTSGRSTEGLLCSNPQYFLSTSDSNYTYWKNATSEIFFYNNAYDDATSFKTAMSGVYLYYELATPTETSFTTASLVTENAEIPLSAENDVLVGKCTEELSSQPGFIDAKIKLTDGDGTCYSNKIQLHVERKPS